MTKSSRWLAASAVAAFAALCACSSKSGTNGNSGSSGGLACRTQFSSACYSCIQTACGSTLGSFESDCSDYIGCYCPGGTYNASAQASQACLAKVTTNPNCISSAGEINDCIGKSCGSECSGGSGTSGDGGGGGGSSGGGSGSGGSGGPTAACGIEFVAGACASCVMANCCSVTQACAQDQACVGIITCLHQCNPQDTTCQSNCVANATSSAQDELNSAGNCWASSCAHSGC